MNKVVNLNFFCIDLILRIRQRNHLLNWNFQPHGCPFQVPSELAAVRGLQGILGKFQLEFPHQPNLPSVHPVLLPLHHIYYDVNDFFWKHDPHYEHHPHESVRPYSRVPRPRTPYTSDLKYPGLRGFKSRIRPPYPQRVVKGD